MRSPSLVPDELDELPWLNFWSLYQDSLLGGPAFRAHGWLSGHPTLDGGLHLTGFVTGFDFADHHWVETTTGFYRLGKPLFDTRPPLVFVHRGAKK